MSPNTFNTYQAFTEQLAAYNDDVYLDANPLDPTDPYMKTVAMRYMYPVLALGEEAGEVLGKVAKFVRKSNSGVDDAMIKQLRVDVAKELGDALYQISEAARQFDYTLQDIVDINYDKLKDRLARGVIVGEGDER